jgi:hypothetical protein
MKCHFQLSFRIRHQAGARKQAGLELNGTEQLLVGAGDVNILGGNMKAIKKNT